MKVQVALDQIDLESAALVAQSLAGAVERFEVGTPLIHRYGTSAISELRAVTPDAILVADCKTMDCGAYDATLAFDAGADELIVQLVAPLQTVESACRVASERNATVMADSLGVTDLPAAVVRAAHLPLSHIILHVGKDEQAAGVEAPQLIRSARDWQYPPALAVAGGINESNIEDLVKELPIDIVVIGEAIYAADNPPYAFNRIQARLGSP